MYKIVLLRHGQSTWNKENRFTGWTDVGLTDQGLAEARQAALDLQKEGYTFNLAFTSFLKRAQETLGLVLNEMDIKDIQIKSSWRLNERHYGALQGLNKAETAQKYGDEQVLQWRRSYDIPPPALTKDDERFSGHDPVYAGVDEKNLPLAECLKDTVARVLPYWDEEIVPEIKARKHIIVSAHGNSLRALVMYLDNVSEADILKLNIPTGIPLVYELDKDLKPIKHYYLGDEEKLKAEMEKVKNQGNAK